MSVVIDFSHGELRVEGRSERAAPAPAKPANEGHGDVRKKIVPVVKPPAGPSVTHWEGGAYALLSQWLAAPAQGGAILLQPEDDPRLLAPTLHLAALIAVDFPRIGDGRGYSQAVLLRERLGYSGPLRAVGAITADQVFALTRVGFSSLALRADQEAETAFAAMRTFSVAYQSTPQAPGAILDRGNANFNALVRLLERLLTEIAAAHERPALASSLSAEDMVITDAIARLKLPIAIFTLMTGRLHQETVDLIQQTRDRYQIDIELFEPAASDIAAFVSAHGRDAFYEGIELRKQCCAIRKVAPLARALSGRDAWITGQRREQAITRGNLRETERDAERAMKKYNPLTAWRWEDVLAYAKRFDVPMSPLYARGYVSIGCEPCTRAIRSGEDPRAGRWWWESQESRECGLHTYSTATV
jgi:phosphoadenosine phosphosulfate reductase